MAKAFASAAGCRFYNIKGSDLSSKYHGISEILIKLLFEDARTTKSIIFFDECESFCLARSEHDADHTSKIKTEMLVQLGEISRNMGVFVIAATNVPHLIDVAFRRRFPKQVYVPLPDISSRKKLFEYEVTRWKNTLSEQNLRDLARKTHGFSNSDIASIAKDARNEPPVEALHSKFFKVNYTFVCFDTSICSI